MIVVTTWILDKEIFIVFSQIMLSDCAEGFHFLDSLKTKCSLNFLPSTF